MGTDSLKGLLSVKTEGFYIKTNLLSSLKLIAIPSTIIPPSSLPQIFHRSFLSCCCSAALALCNTYYLSPPAHFLHVRYIELFLIGIFVRRLSHLNTYLPDRCISCVDLPHPPPLPSYSVSDSLPDAAYHYFKSENMWEEMNLCESLDVTDPFY